MMARSLDDYQRLIKFGSCSWNYPVGWNGTVYHFEDEERPQLSLFADFSKTNGVQAGGQQSITIIPKEKKGYGAELLSQYCAYPYFSTLCFDMTHYRPFTARELNAFAEYLTPNFPVMIKVWDQVTKIGHWKNVVDKNGKLMRKRMFNQDFLNADIFIERFLPPFQEAFDEHIGMFLFEFMRLGYFDHTKRKWVDYDPNSFNQALYRFLSKLPKQHRYAIEIRDRNLVNHEYAKILRDHGVAHCFNQWESMLSIQEQYQIVGFTTDFAAGRVLTPPAVKYSTVQKAYMPYDRIQRRLPEVRREIMQLIDEALWFDIELFITINNRAEGNSPATIAELDAIAKKSLSLS